MNNLLRKAAVALSLAVASTATEAQNLSTLRSAGPRDSNINFVLLAEGYTAAEEAKFGADAMAKITGILADDAWSPFADRINAFGIYVASVQSGSDDPTQGITRDTYFNSSFGVLGLQRLLGIPPFTPNNTNSADGVGKVNALLAQFAPDYDVVILIVNSTTYGGAGGFPTITSLHGDSDEVVLHELGHSFALLTDEYVDAAAAPNYPPAEHPNATQVTDRALVAWAKFIDPSTPVPTISAPNENVVGLFEGAHYRATGFYRPTFNNKMRSLGRPWGPVNLRQFATRVHGLDLDSAVNAPTISVQPAPAIVASGQLHVVQVHAGGTGPLTYQWSFNGRFIPGATASSHTIASVTPATTGNYSAEVTNARGATTSATVWIGVPGSFAVPTITLQPVSQSAVSGNAVQLSANATSDAQLSFQWRRNGVDIEGATSSTLSLSSVQAFHAGEYSVVVSNFAGSVTSSVATVTVAAAPDSSARLMNLSTRALCLTGDNLLIPGFVITGSGVKRLLIRAVGPELANFGVTGVLDDPRFTLKRTEPPGTIDIATNDNWSINANLAELISTTNTVGAFPLTPGSLDAALLVDLVPGAYTVVTSGANDGTGVSIVELYDASAAGGGARLSNISNRGFVGTGGDIMIPGFVISAEGSKTLLLRAVGPKLADFGVSGVLEDPMLSVFRVDPTSGLGQLILTNDNWGENSDAAGVAATAVQVGAFELDAASKDAAFVVSLPPGVYTVQASGVGGTTGVAIVEVYVVE